MSLEEQSKEERQYYIDWLRVFSIFMMVFYHIGRIFDSDAFHIENNPPDIGMTRFTGFVRIWIIALFFVR